MGFLASDRLGKGHTDILHDCAATKNRLSIKAFSASIAYSPCEEVGTLSLQLPMGLGIEHHVNFNLHNSTEIL